MNKSFTLIELLVVVLIIGILSAIALPQYTLAVNRARFANLRTMVNALVKAAEAYQLETGEYPSGFDELAVDLPGNFSVAPATKATCGSTDEMYCCIVPKDPGSWAAAISCGQKDYSFIAHHILYNNKDYCVADQNNSDALKLCRSLGSISSWTSIPTSDGIKSNHPYYVIN